MITIEKTTDKEYRITIEEKSSKSVHKVTVEPEYYQKITQGKISMEEYIQLSFEFLLKREPKESILPAFNIQVINRYFPEYEKVMHQTIS